MNILQLELEYIPSFHVLPHVSITLGRSFYIQAYWLNFCVAVKHISSVFKANVLRVYSPSITLQQYRQSGYKCTFEIDFLGYTYRKGLIKRKDAEIVPWDNTPGIVHSSWFHQFQSISETKLSVFIDKMMTEMEKLIKEKEDDISRK